MPASVRILVTLPLYPVAPIRPNRLGGHFLTFFRHEAHIFRHDVERVFQHFFRQRHFQIQARADGVFNGEHVRIFNMAAVFTQVHGNQICAVGSAISAASTGLG